MANDTIVDIYCHIVPEKFFQEMNRIAPRLGNIAARLRGVKKLFDLDERFREMDQFGDYRQIVSLPNPPIEDFAAGDIGLNLARIGNDAMADLCARHPARITRPSRNRGSRCGGASAGPTRRPWRWCVWSSTVSSTAIPG